MNVMKTWMITGANSGFGRILTEKLLERGDRVAATVRRPETLADLSAAHGDRLLIVTLDLRDGAAIEAAVSKSFDAFGRVDFAVSNAGYGVFGAAEEASDVEMKEIIDTNLIGSIRLIKALLPRLRAQGGGRILQVASEGGQIAYPGFSLYHATKWGIEGFVESVAQEVRGFGIQFTIVEPGATRTNFGAGIVMSEPMDAYDGTPPRALIAAAQSGDWVIAGDPVRMVDAIIASTEREDAPLRLTLGVDAYHHVRDGLTARLAALEAQKDIALASDYTADELARL
ncbi:SDR family oxidoreductase [Ciceribacter sp. L1K23]|uniref:SDR family oxidoreductase n=1 Tax=Ciceribacter sp. L1K23 TaxID=2820276 RepID=UPI001B836A1B|nr:SDR family oxidoreductase [Ciceribacter sp. L1K23]MBR0554656.1 SDR family oxidoreductase [Ciceribacter sp. L1K23]